MSLVYRSRILRSPCWQILPRIQRVKHDHTQPAQRQLSHLTPRSGSRTISRSRCRSRVPALALVGSQAPQFFSCSHLSSSPDSLRPLRTTSSLRLPASSASFSTSSAQLHQLTAAPLTIEAYHEYADDYLETLLSKLEDVGETKLDLDVEFSAGVLNCVFPPHGTYVLNKQPPNKQIWLSSPVSGPKRYDYVLAPGNAEAEGEWVYLRDGSRLSDLLREELGVEMETGA